MAIKNNDDYNLSLFDTDEVQEHFDSSNKLDVVKMEYIGAESIEWKELFDGFDKLYAITFSSGINFVYKLLDMFEYSEVIFGCESVISYNMSGILAYQNNLIEKMREKASKSKINLLDKIDSGNAKFYVARKQISHEKIYLLEANDGRKRVVMGSANMSFNAFGGRQRENICYIDGEQAYEWYKDVFDSLKENSTDEITYKAIDIANITDNIDNLPIAETVKVQKVLALEINKDNNEEINFILDTQNLAKTLTPIVPKAEKKTGKILLSPETFIKLRRHIKDESVREKELRSEYPQLAIDAFKQTVSLNGAEVDLHPTNEEIKHDVNLFISYMEGYKKFHGDYEGMQYRYFEFANWFFCSPFMATMRDMAARFDQNKLPYPVFGLVYGQSKAGKTSFLETLLKMMIGQKPKVSAPDFTRSSIEALKRTVQGAPIIVDDLTNNRFNQHAIETIKNDDFGVSEHLINYSAVVISANEDVKAVAPEVIRRTVICRVEAGLTNTEVMKSNVVRNVQQKIGTAFYREYLRRMLEVIPDLIEQLRAEETESAPDILKFSSEIIVDIINQFAESTPKYIKTLSLENYFSEQVTGKYAIKTIRNAWKTSRKSFMVIPKSNELRYHAGQTYDAARLIKELPETLEAHTSREWVVMNLEEAKDFFDIKFKKGFFGV
ncbi:MAG: phospholipase D-like domain-containing protein [Acutalibacteraceae bacterium]|nr:phospholipase D-like domain-containing protein [Acutalibacteraceae bacterium]